MTTQSAGELVEYSKTLFRFQTPAQGKVLFERFERFANPLYVQQTLEHFAAHPPIAGENGWTEGNLPLVAIVERIDGEDRRMGKTTEDERKREQKQQEAKTSASWSKINELVDSLDDTDLAELKVKALEYLPPAARKLLVDRPVRESKTLRGLVYRAFDEMRSQR